MEMANVEEVQLHWPPRNAHLMLLPLQRDCSPCSVLLEDFLSTAYSAFSLPP